jgi:hypothetical protein
LITSRRVDVPESARGCAKAALSGEVAATAASKETKEAWLKRLLLTAGLIMVLLLGRSVSIRYQTNGR